MAVSWINRSLKDINNDLSIFLDGRLLDLDTAEGYKWRLEMLSRELLALQLEGELNESECIAVEYLLKAYSAMIDIVEKLQNMRYQQSTERSPTVSIVCDGSVGRPRFELSKAQLESLLEEGFSVPDISSILGVSVSTVRRRMNEFGLSVRQMYTNIAPQNLQQIIGEVQSSHLYWGNRMMYGYLKSIGIRVPFHTVREIQAQTDPEGSVMRRLRFLNRRQYSVPGPQWLWHVDGNHKLIR